MLILFVAHLWKRRGRWNIGLWNGCDRCCNSDECQGVTDATSIDLNVEGGKLVVSFDKKDNQYTNVYLKGPAEFVFKEL
jgi:hypothetical protein